MRKSTWGVLGAFGLFVLANAACGGDTAVPPATNTTGADAGKEPAIEDAGSEAKPEVPPGTIVVGALSSPTVGEEGTTATFTVKLGDKPVSDVSIVLTSSDASEATLSAKELTFTADDWDAPQTVTVKGVDDDVQDGDQKVVIAFAASVSADPRYSGRHASPLTITNVDDDTAGIFIGAAGSTTVSETGTSATLAVRLRSKPATTVYVPVVSSSETEGKVAPSALVFTPENYFVSQNVTVTGQADAVKDADQVFDVTAGKAVSPDPAYKDAQAKISLTNTNESVEQLATDWTMACVRYTSGRVQCWGKNDNGGNGYGDTNSRGDQPGEMANLPFVDLGTGHTAKQLIGSMNTEGSMCAIRDDDKIVCWGWNGEGAFGTGITGGNAFRIGDQPGEMGDNLLPTILGAGRTAKGFWYSHTHACARLDNDQFKCWGDGAYGALLQGNSNSRMAPSDLGDNIPAVNIGSGRTVKKVAVSFNKSCAILDDDKVKCWGWNGFGNLGYGDTNTRGDDPSELGDNLPYVDLANASDAVKDVAMGIDHACAVLDDGSVNCWGNGQYGTLGNGNQNVIGDGPNEMGTNLVSVPLGNGRTAKSITAGWYHTCAILDDDSVKCWGYNGYGQLGQGDTSNRGDDPNELATMPAVDVGSGRKVVSLHGAIWATCALLDNGWVKCWGDNEFGVIGQGDTLWRGNAPGQMGDKLPRVPLKW